MGAGRKKETHSLAEGEQIPRRLSVNGSVSARNLSKNELAGVIFGCKNHTKKECLSNLVFGLPDGHFSYIRKIEPGLPLFLFNYSDRTMLGIYEAAGHGMRNINPHAWTANGTEATEYPAQVRVRIRKQCQALTEEQFREVLHKNYAMDQKHFWFELDHIQTGQLISLFELSKPPPTSTYNKPIQRRPCGIAPNLDSRQEDIYRRNPATLEADPKGFNMETDLPAEYPYPTRKWVSLFKENSDSDPRSEKGAPLVSKVNWDDESVDCLNETNINSSTYVVTSCLEEARQPTNFRRCWKEDTTPSWDYEATDSGVNHFGVEVDAYSGNTPCWEEKAEPLDIIPYWEDEAGPSSISHSEDEKQFLEFQSPKEERKDEEECVYSRLKHMSLNWRSSDNKEYTADVRVTCVNNISHFKSRFSLAASSATEKENSSSDEVDSILRHRIDFSHLEDVHCSAALSASEKDISVSEEERKDSFVPHGLCNLYSEDCNTPASPSTPEEFEDCFSYSSDKSFVIDELMQELKEVKAYAMDQHSKTIALEKKLDDSGALLEHLRHHVMMLESQLQDPSVAGVQVCNHSGRIEQWMEVSEEPHVGVDEMVFIMGGYDGVTWLPRMDCYSPSIDMVKSFKPMSSVRSHASAVMLKGLVYNIGGWNAYGDNMWYDTVECYNPFSNKWIMCPPLSEKKGCLAAASLNDKIFATGGGNGQDCFNNAEMFDAAIGRWIPTQPMLQKRFASAAADLNGAIYVVGGYDGKNYLKSVERYDPREAFWSKLQNMMSNRGSHALTVFKGKLYALGGYDGYKYVSSVEIFDPRMGLWLAGNDMKQSRGYFAAPVIGDTIYAIGGQSEGNNIQDSVEIYRLGHGWSGTKLKGVGRRSFFSAVRY